MNNTSRLPVRLNLIAAALCCNYSRIVMVVAMLVLASGVPSSGIAAMSAANLVAQGIRHSESGDHAQALQIFQKAAQLGDADAMYRVGYQFENGLGVTTDSVLARRWFVEAAQRGHSDAMTALGHLFSTGRGVQKNSIWAMNWYGAAAKRGNVDAMYHIGWMFASGETESRDLAVAHRWYEEAASRGSSYALLNLGVMSFYGQGVALDMCAAQEYYRRALKADSRNAIALSNLGINYVNGVCGKADEVTGRRYLNQAKRLGSADAARTLADLDRQPPSPYSDGVSHTTTVIEYEWRTRYEAPPPPPTYTPPISSFYGEPCWGCLK